MATELTSDRQGWSSAALLFDVESYTVDMGPSLQLRSFSPAPSPTSKPPSPRPAYERDNDKAVL